MVAHRYLCDIIGKGTEDDPFRPAVADYGNYVDYSAAFPEQNMETGEYLSSTCVAVVDIPDHSIFIGDSRIDLIPENDLEKPIEEVSTKDKTDLEAALVKRGITVDPFSEKVTYQDSVEEVCKAIDSNFSIDAVKINVTPVVIDPIIDPIVDEKNK